MSNKWISDEEIKMLIERNETKPVKKYVWTSAAYRDRPPQPICPVCGQMIYHDEYKFCPNCGQRIDTQTWEL